MKRYLFKSDLRLSVRQSWEQFKNRPEYQTGAFPFPPRRLGLFEKLHNRFIAAVMLAGFIFLLIKLVAYVIDSIAPM